jgi:tRNA(fMet)-specific endonuclease VapC
MSPQFLLDTNICIYIAKQKPISVLKKFEQLVTGQVAMSTITYGELQFGAQKSHHPHTTLKMLEELRDLIPPLPMPIETGKIYGEIRSKLEKKGMPIGNNDLWIAAHALAIGVVLVTNNDKEFRRIPHLKIDNWVAAEK